MEDIFSTLNGALDGPLPLALLAALVWGAASIFLSPCHLAGIPLVVGFVAGEGGTHDRRRALRLSAAFAGGMFVALAVLGVAVAVAGYFAGSIGPVGNYVIAALFLVAGLNLLGLVPLPAVGLKAGSVKKKGALAAFIIGLVFGLGLSPCTFAFLAPVYGVAFNASATSVPAAVSLVTAFAIGHCAVMVVAGVSTGWVQRTLAWNEGSRAVRLIKGGAGLLLIAAAAYLLYTA